MPIWIDREAAKGRNRVMKITRTMLVAVAVWLTAAAAVFAANPHLGTWKLNESKSKLVGGTKNNTVTYSEAKNGMMKLSVEGVDKDGKATHWTWEGKFDGKPYKVKGNTNMGTIAVAKDGKSRVVTANDTDANGKKVTDKAYYDKQ